MSTIEFSPVDGKTEAPWSVFVVFDDPTARVRATSVCDFITAKFWPDLEFDLHWCDVHRLGSVECAQRAVECATTARIVIVATSARAELPQSAVNWLDNWSRLRHGREGALIALIESSSEPHISERTDFLLRRAAHQAGLDYLTHAPEFGLAPLPDEPEWINAKAEQLGPILGDILTAPVPPPHQK